MITHTSYINLVVKGVAPLQRAFSKNHFIFFKFENYDRITSSLLKCIENKLRDSQSILHLNYSFNMYDNIL
jgi:hypothetical protein